MTLQPEIAATSAPSNLSRLPDARRLRTYGIWAGWATLTFFAVYPTMNWLTSLRPHRLHLYLPAELAIPFVPQLIWAYISMYALFPLPIFLVPAERMPALGKQLVAAILLGGLIFLLLPAELGFTRTIPDDPLLAALFKGIFGVDKPHNLVPSLHVVWSGLFVLTCADVVRPLARGVLYAWLAIIVASTVFVHQHHVLDVVAAIPLVFVLRRFFRVPHVQEVSSGRRTAADAARLR